MVKHPGRAWPERDTGETHVTSHSKGTPRSMPVPGTTKSKRARRRSWRARMSSHIGHMPPLLRLACHASVNRHHHSTMRIRKQGVWDPEQRMWLRPDGEPSPFESIPVCLWWATVTMTTGACSAPITPLLCGHHPGLVVYLVPSVLASSQSGMVICAPSLSLVEWWRWSQCLWHLRPRSSGSACRPCKD